MYDVFSQVLTLCNIANEVEIFVKLINFFPTMHIQGGIHKRVTFLLMESKMFTKEVFQFSSFFLHRE